MQALRQRRRRGPGSSRTTTTTTTALVLRSSLPPSSSSQLSSTGGIAGEKNREKKRRKKEKYLPNPTLIKGRPFHIKNVDGTFLDSEERLASAMLNVVDASRLTLLSYHCHGMSPEVLLESHISFHTWPE